MSFTERLRSLFSRSQPKSLVRQPLVLVVVEGRFDIEFLKRISKILAAGKPDVPDLAALERRRELMFFPFGGDPWLWADRLAPLGLPEFHLYDREAPPETELRERAANTVNLRPGCRAVLTSKRSLENYLHPQSIAEACGIEVEFGDHDHVGDLVAEESYRTQDQVPWCQLPRRTQVRRRNRVKKWLHTKAVEHMTAERLAERDPQGEVVSWLKSIVRLANHAPA
jgi:hypothetical protein